jgi:AbrB family looped-hinge helix DNA binding protein
MPTVSKIKKKGQLTVPKEIMEKFNLAIGDVLEFSIEENEIKLKPVKVMAIPKDELWAWQPDVIAGMKESVKLYKEGKFKFYTGDNLKEMFEEWDKE